MDLVGQDDGFSSRQDMVFSSVIHWLLLEEAMSSSVPESESKRKKR